jgi:hypothetical protein
MTTLTVLPHSSACVERIFSQINCVKTKITNSLKVETVKDRLLAKQSITRNNATCTSWQPQNPLVNLKTLKTVQFIEDIKKGLKKVRSRSIFHQQTKRRRNYDVNKVNTHYFLSF